MKQGIRYELRANVTEMSTTATSSYIAYAPIFTFTFTVVESYSVAKTIIIHMESRRGDGVEWKCCREEECMRTRFITGKINII